MLGAQWTITAFAGAAAVAGVAYLVATQPVVRHLAATGDEPPVRVES